jgi:hypothetical protein
MKVIKVRKKDGMTVKKFGTAEAGIDFESDTGKYFLRAESRILNGFRHTLANTPEEGVQLVDSYITFYKKHIKDLEAVKKWFLQN